MSEKAYKEEEHMRTHPDDADEGTVAEVTGTVFDLNPVQLFLGQRPSRP